MRRSSFRLTGKTALITGAAARIGKATALALASRGVHVVVHYNTSREEAEDLAATLRSRNVNSLAIQADLSDPGQAEDLFAEAVRCAGPIGILINNASVFEEDRLSDLTPHRLSASIRLHAVSPLLLSRRMAAQNIEGCIINILDTRIPGHDSTHASYQLGKQMLHSLTASMAMEFAPGVRVNAVAPGLILPPAGKEGDYLETLSTTVPLLRHGGPEDITRAVLFLLESTFVTGQVIYVDGGRHLTGNTHGGIQDHD